MMIRTDKENIKDIVPYKDMDYMIFGPDGLQATDFFMKIREIIGWERKDRYNCDSIRGIYTVEDFPKKDCYIFSRLETYETKSYSTILEYVKLNTDKIFIFVLLNNPPFKDKGYDDFLANLISVQQQQNQQVDDHRPNSP